MRASIGHPHDSSVMPNVASIPTCPSAVPPPWLPIAGTMTGSAPRPRTCSTVARTATAMFAMPLLPAVIATRCPGCTRVPRSSDASASSTLAATSATSGPLTDWRAKKNEGRTPGSRDRTAVASSACQTPSAAHFDERGYLRVPGAFTAEAAAAMRDVVWRALERNGIMRDDPENWTNESPSHLQSLKGVDVFKSIGSERTLSAIDDIIGAGRWKPPADWGRVLPAVPDPTPVDGAMERLAPRPRLHRAGRRRSTVSRCTRCSVTSHHAVGGHDDRGGFTPSRGAPLRGPSAPARRQSRGRCASSSCAAATTCASLGTEVSDAYADRAVFVDTVEVVDGVRRSGRRADCDRAAT